MKYLALLLSACLALAANAENRAFCRVADGAKSLTYAPTYLYPSWATPTPADYLAKGWLHNRVTSPTNAVGMTAHLDRYEARGEAVYAVYRYIPVPIAIPRYSIADLTFWCVGKGKMDAVAAALKETGYYEVYLTTQEVVADNELFQPTLRAIAAKVGFTDADIAEALAYSLIGGAE